MEEFELHSMVSFLVISVLRYYHSLVQLDFLLNLDMFFIYL